MTTLYEIRYESLADSGTLLILATSDEKALAKFSADWSDFGDPVPTHWITNRWSLATT